MTRINVVPPAELHRKHLLAEYRELPRVFDLARKWAKRVNAWEYTGPYREIPDHYVLGKGHVLFFYDKLLFLSWRFVHLVNECEQRGYSVQFTANPRVRWESRTPSHLWNDWEPTPEALRINRARIADRLSTMQA